MLRTTDRMIGTESKLVCTLASCVRLEATPVALPKSRPSEQILIDLRTVNDESPCEVSETPAASVTVRLDTSPCTSRSKQISSESGVKRTFVDCSTVRVPRTLRPITNSSTGPVITVVSGSIFSRNCWCTATRTFAER